MAERSRRLTLLAGTVLVATTSCATPEPSVDPAGDVAAPPFIGHVHGLGTDPADGTLYVAAHGGVFAVDDQGAELVADRAQDTMGFTVTGPGRFLASGHPDLRETDLPSHLGLLESRDAGQTWSSLSLSGEADFHSLDAGKQIYGFDGLSRSVMASADGTSWESWGEGDVIDLAADPSRDRVLATTPGGELLEIAAEGATQMAAPSGLAFVDWPEADLAVGVDRSGQVWRGTDGVEDWQRVGEPMGQPSALDVTRDAWYLAIEEDVLVSVDEGETWRSVRLVG